MPVPSAEKPWIVCSHVVRKKNVAITEADRVKAASDTPLNVGMRNSRRSNIGCSRRSSIGMKAISRSTPTMNTTSSRVLVQP